MQVRVPPTHSQALRESATREMTRRRKHINGLVPDRFLLSADPQLRNPANRVPSGGLPSPGLHWDLAFPPPLPPSPLETGMCFSCNILQGQSRPCGDTYSWCCLLHPRTCRPGGTLRLWGHCWENWHTKGLCPLPRPGKAMRVEHHSGHCRCWGTRVMIFCIFKIHFKWTKSFPPLK